MYEPSNDDLTPAEVSRHNRERVLDEAFQAVMTDRSSQYGRPEENFADIARLWEAYTGYTFSLRDVAVMNILQKIARSNVSPNKRDHWTDIAGYSACAYGCACEDVAKEDGEG